MMNSFACAIVAAVLLVGGIASSSLASAAPAAEVYGALPDTTRAIVSPDAMRVAFIQPAQSGADAVAIYKLDSDAPPCVVAPTAVKIRGVSWAGSSRLIVKFSFAKVLDEGGNQRRLHEWTRAIVMDADCTNGKQLLREHEMSEYVQSNAAGVLQIAPDGNSALVESYSFNGVDEQQLGSRIAVKQRGLTFDVYRVDLATGKSEIFESGSTDTVGWLTDASGQVRVRIDHLSSRYEVFARVSGSKDWVHVYGYGDAEPSGKEIIPVGFGADPDVLLVLTRAGHDRTVAAKFDLKTRALNGTIFEHPKVDVDGYATDGASGKVVGAIYTLDSTQISYFDPAWAHIQQVLQSSFAGNAVYITSATPDAKTVVALVAGPDNPSGAYYIIDLAKGSASKIGERYGHVVPADYAPVKAITYKARDGMQIPAYLTLPPGAPAKNLPLVVFPHGGPASRDSAEFDWWAQFLATRGYAVLQPNFRGSTGYGNSFELAGHKQWGLAMQSDLSDGVKYLIEQGMVDSKRVCIVGASYGGYAALAGMTLTPELYRCGVSVAGISDLPKFLGYERQQGYTDFGPGDYQLDNIGSPFTDVAQLNATSPAQHAAAMTGTLLLIHGNNDTVVPIVQSELMAAALDKAGKHCEFVRLEGEDHWLSSAKTRTEMLKAVEAFLAKNLKTP